MEKIENLESLIETFEKKIIYRDSLINVFETNYRNGNKRLEIEDIIASSYNETTEHFEQLPLDMQKRKKYTFRNNIYHIRTYFEDNGHGFLIVKIEKEGRLKGVWIYKLSTNNKEDHTLILITTEKCIRKTKRISNRCDIRIENFVEQGAISQGEIKGLEDKVDEELEEGK